MYLKSIVYIYTIRTTKDLKLIIIIKILISKSKELTWWLVVCIYTWNWIEIQIQSIEIHENPDVKNPHPIMSNLKRRKSYPIQSIL